MNNEIKAEIKSIKKVLCDDESFYQIPNYQRPYSWDKDHVSDLIDDLINAFNHDPEENYFCGSLVLVKDDQKYDVIDGQQRLTTFTILSCVLRDFFCEEKEHQIKRKAKDLINNSIKDQYDETKQRLKFLTSEENQNTFQQTVVGRIIAKDKNNLKNNKYLENAYLIKEFLEEKKQDIGDINKWIEFIFEKVVITTIICPNQDTAIQIFNVLNDRGMPLTSVDILKSTLMQKLDKENKESKRSFVAAWNKIENKLESHELDFTNLFQTYLYYVKASNPKTTLHKELLSTFKDKDPLQIIDELGRFAEHYRNIHNSNDKYIYCFKYLRHSIYWVSILTTASFVKAPYFDKLKTALLAYYYQTWISGGTTARIKQTSFSILQIIKKESSFDKIKEHINSNLQKYNTIADYTEKVNSPDVYQQTWLKPILFLLEYFSKDDSNQSFLELGGKKIQIEHVFPRNPNNLDDWNFSEEDKEEYLDSLGNLTLLSGRKNSQASNSSFKKKKEIYKNKDNVATSFEITRKVFANHEWTSTEIEKRKEASIKKLNKIFELEQ